MTIYLMISIFIFLMGLLNLVYMRPKKTNFLWGGILIIFIFVFRSLDLGNDIFKPGGYIPSYILVKDWNFPMALTHKLYNFERGFIILNFIISKISNGSINFYLFIIGSLIFAPLIHIFRDESVDPNLSLYVYISLGLLYFNFSALRQSIAISLSYLSMYFINKSFLLYSLVIILASTFHKSAIVLLPLYIFYKRSKSNYFYISQIFIVIYLIYLIVSNFSDINVLKQEYSLNYFIFINGIYILLYIFMDSEQKSVPANKIYLNQVMISVMLQLFSTQIPLIKRATYYFYMGFYMLIPQVIIESKKIKNRQIIYMIVSIFLLIFNIFQLVEDPLNIVPFKFKFIK